MRCYWKGMSGQGELDIDKTNLPNVEFPQWGEEPTSWPSKPVDSSRRVEENPFSRLFSGSLPLLVEIVLLRMKQAQCPHLWSEPKPPIDSVPGEACVAGWDSKGSLLFIIRMLGYVQRKGNSPFQVIYSNIDCSWIIGPGGVVFFWIGAYHQMTSYFWGDYKVKLETYQEQRCQLHELLD